MFRLLFKSFRWHIRSNFYPLLCRWMQYCIIFLHDSRLLMILTELFAIAKKKYNYIIDKFLLKHCRIWCHNNQFLTFSYKLKLKFFSYNWWLSPANFYAFNTQNNQSKYLAHVSLYEQIFMLIFLKRKSLLIINQVISFEFIFRIWQYLVILSISNIYQSIFQPQVLVFYLPIFISVVC
jgi:hypothetical protein